MRNITVEELKSRLDAGEKLHILDVREPFEYTEYNIGGLLLPLGKVMSLQLDAIEDWKDQEVIVHCKAGSRSLQACMMLESAGYTNVVNVVGGTLAWKQKFG